MAADPDCVVVAQAALRANDAPAFAAACAEMGLALELSTYRALCAAHDGWAELVSQRLLEQVYAALHNELGYAFLADFQATMLVARADDRVVIGTLTGTTRQQPFRWGWPIAGWSKANRAKNVPLVLAWAREAELRAGTPPYDHVIVAPRLRVAEAVTETSAVRASGDALFAALVADPEDLGTRAVYADWLIERGDPRGEIMRLHAEGKLDEARTRAMAMRDVVREHLKGVVQHAQDETGLVESFQIVADQLAKRGAELFSRHPVHAMHLIATDRKQLQKLATADLPLERIRTLHLEGRSVRKMSGTTCEIGPSALRATRVFANLRRLRLEGIADDVAEWRRFLGELCAPHLADLAVHDRALDPLVAHLVVAPATLPGIESLSLGSYQLDVTIARTIAQRERLTTLSTSVWDPAIAEVAAALAESPSLVDIELWRTPMDDAAVRALARGKFERVHIHARCSPAAVAELVERLPLHTLVLDMTYGTAVADALVDVLVAAPPRLTRVSVGGTLTGAQAARIAATRTLVRD